jgi:hypothetical protein
MALILMIRFFSSLERVFRFSTGGLLGLRFI